jgi:hypothetical protein
MCQRVAQLQLELRHQVRRQRQQPGIEARVVRPAQRHNAVRRIAAAESPWHDVRRVDRRSPADQAAEARDLAPLHGRCGDPRGRYHGPRPGRPGPRRGLSREAHGGIGDEGGEVRPRVGSVDFGRVCESRPRTRGRSWPKRAEPESPLARSRQEFADQLASVPAGGPARRGPGHRQSGAELPFGDASTAAGRGLSKYADGMAARVPFIEEMISATDISDLVSCHLFDAVPFIFEGDETKWRKWRTELAFDLDVDQQSVFLVGSSAVGVSLNPHKNLRIFGDDSDVDVAVLSYRHFEDGWRTLRSMSRTARLRLSPAAQIDLKEHAPNYIYFGSIATDRILSALPFGPRWAKAIEQAKTRAPTLDRDVKLRLYRDVESLRRYQMRSVRMTRDRATKKDGS